MKKEIVIKEVNGHLTVEVSGFTKMEQVGIFESLRVRTVVAINRIMDEAQQLEHLKEKFNEA